MKVFEGTHDAFQMLGRLVSKGKLRNFNDAIADELIGAGYALVGGDELLPTVRGEEIVRTVLWPARQPQARLIASAVAPTQSMSG